MAHKSFEFNGGHDTGNGAIVYTGRSREYPNVVCKQFSSYCGREKNKEWYEIEGDPTRREFKSAEAAQRAASELKAIPTKVLENELARRKNKR